MNRDIDNASETALLKSQKAFANITDSTGVRNEDEVQSLFNEVRYDKSEIAKSLFRIIEEIFL